MRTQASVVTTSSVLLSSASWRAASSGPPTTPAPRHPRYAVSAHTSRRVCILRHAASFPERCGDSGSSAVLRRGCALHESAWSLTNVRTTKTPDLFSRRSRALPDTFLRNDSDHCVMVRIMPIISTRNDAVREEEKTAASKNQNAAPEMCRICHVMSRKNCKNLLTVTSGTPRVLYLPVRLLGVLYPLPISDQSCQRGRFYVPSR